ncbi:MAG: carbonic anhydrase [Candidatus Kryptonium sp.]
MNAKKFATAINCIDGRTQIPVIEWLKKEYKIDYVDMITEPGPNKILSENKDSFTIQAIRRKVEISLTKHNSKIIAITGHHDCAANPVDRETHLKQILSAVETIKMWNLGVDVIGLWVDENWEVHKVE